MDDINFPLKISLVVLITCFLELQIETPFPEAKPSALTTIGKSHLFKNFTTWLFSLQIANLAVGILFLINNFHKSF